MSEQPMLETSPPAKQDSSCLQRALLISLAIFLLTGAAAAIIFVMGVFQVRQGMQRLGQTTGSVGEYVRQLVVPVTPVVLASPITVLRNIQDEARLLTLTADFQKNIIADSKNEILWGLMGEKLIFEAHGTVAAGIDLTQLSEGDIIVVAPDTIWVRLPKAEIFTDLPILDSQKSRVLHRDTGLLTRADPNLETLVRQQAEIELLEVAQNSDLLIRANLNAQLELRKIIGNLGFSQIIFFADEFPPVTPYAQEAPKGFIITTPEP